MKNDHDRKKTKAAEIKNPTETDTDIEYETEDQQPADKIKKLKNQLAECQQEKQKCLDDWHRAKADFVNARQRDEAEKTKTREFIYLDISDKLLPVLDSFDMAFANQKVWQQVDQNWRSGVEQIHSQLRGVLKELNLEEFLPQIGENFDPVYHEALESVTVAKEDDGTIRELIQKGYKMGERVVRTAKVKVGQTDEN